MRKRFELNDGWGFTERFSDELLNDDCGLSLKAVRLPHTVTETPLHYFDEKIYQMVSGYRKELFIPNSFEGSRIFVHFGGAAHEASVYINGQLIAVHSCGYTAFEAELTEFLRYGAVNILAVKLDSRETLNIPPFGHVIDYMTFGGLYREAYIEVTDSVRIADVFAMPQIEEELSPAIQEGLKRSAVRIHGSVESVVRIDSDVDTDEDEYSIGLLFNGREIMRIPLSGAEKKEAAGSEGLWYSFSADAGTVRLWDIVSPKLYKLEYILIFDDEVIDSFSLRTGFRKAEFKKDGFFLNGRKVILRGLNRHQTYPYIGYAAPESLQRLDADILRKELALNAVRTSHYPQSQHFIDRCDELGLLVFTEIPGWQHIGDEKWKEIAVNNVKEMVRQYRNHPSVILWGVRINESVDDDELYERTNGVARALDPTRSTGGVRYLKKSSFLEDVYTYNDFLHDGTNAGCEKKADVTPDMERAYLISEYNGHMYPTKPFDSEEHRQTHALRHANVLDAVRAEKDIAGSFGWCFTDYPTHKDFGSGDRVCYHGVTDFFRNPKLAAGVYSSFQDKHTILEISSAMAIGEHPGGSLGRIWIITNADSVRMYQNDILIKEYSVKDSAYKHLKHGPIMIDDFIGSKLKDEGFSRRQEQIVKNILNSAAIYGMNDLPSKIKIQAIEALAVYRMTFADAYRLYQKYIGGWGDKTTVWKFEAVKDGSVVKTVTKSPFGKLNIELICGEDIEDNKRSGEGSYGEDADVASLPDNEPFILTEKETYDMALVRVHITDEYGNIMPFYNGHLKMKLDGPIEQAGPDYIEISGGMGGILVRTCGKEGSARLTASFPDGRQDSTEAAVDFMIKIKKTQKLQTL